VSVATLNLAEIEYLEANDDDFRGFLRRFLVKTYVDFVDGLYDDICHVLTQLETNIHLYPEDEYEDATTQRIVDMLSVMGYTASHNKASGGSVDITVELTRRRWKWISEAKKFNSVADLREGYLQLATRYRPGLAGAQKAFGALFGYLRRPNAAQAVTAWKDELVTIPEASGSTLEPCTRRGPLAFYSEHQHAALGVPFRVWHVCVPLYFDPKDKSGRTAKKYK
jgi:hypothetical protein